MNGGAVCKSGNVLLGNDRSQSPVKDTSSHVAI